MKYLLLATLAFFAFTHDAHALILDITLGTPGSSVSAGSLIGNVDLSTLGGSLALNNAAVVPALPPIPNQYTPPNNGIGLFGNTFLTVYGANQSPNNSPFNGSAIFTLPAQVADFAFTWGTVDPYNTLILKDATHTFTITGQDILNIIGGPAGSVETDVSFMDPFGPILTAELDSSQNSFEAANFTEAPLPGALAMFAAALLGFVFFARRKVLSRV